MRPPVIADIGHLAVRTPHVEEAVAHATQVMGLREVERRDGWVYLTHGREHHSLCYAEGERDEVDHLGLEASGPAGLAEVRERVRRGGYEVVSETPLNPGVADGFAFVGHEDYVYEVYHGLERTQPRYDFTGVKPKRLGHFNTHPQDPDGARAFFEDVFDFRLCDTIEGQGYFLRCNAEHHGMALLRGRGTLHHHAWQVETIAELAQLADRLDGQGRSVLWGPVRHGVGENIAVYFADPTGAVVEYYADMEHIYDEAGFEPRTWDPENPKWYSLWSPGRPEGFRDYGLPAAIREA